MTFQQALRKGIDILKDAKIEAPAVDAGVMLCHAAGCDRVYLYSHGEDILDKVILEKYMGMVTNRSEGMPVQYITGRQEFMSLDFDVQRGVLIPRQDTEILVEAVTGFCKQLTPPVKILDIGTGSGCIAVSLAYYMNECSVVAVDISEKALNIARCNAVKNKVSEKVTFTAGSLFDNLDSVRFDIIVSNPPYARRHDICTLQREVKDHEPVEALDGGEDGLWFYREIAEKAPEFLKPGGLLAFEVGYDQAEAVMQILESDYTDIAVIKDIAGIKRVVTGKLKSIY